MKIEIDVEIPDGWEFVRYGHARHRDWFLDHGSKVVQWNMSPSFRQYIILRRKRPEFVDVRLPVAAVKYMAGTWAYRDTEISRTVEQACLDALTQLEAQHDSDN